MSQVLIVDLSSIVHPAWHVHANDPDPNSVSQSAVARVRGLASGQEYAAICVDSGKSFRVEISADYKAHREAKPEAFREQYRRACETLERDGFLILRADGFEADDLIAGAAAWASENGHETTIATADKDLTQLLTLPGVTLYSLTKNEPVDAAAVEAKFGVRPDQMRDYLALVGDTSDNVRGVPGIGPKRAAQLLRTHGSIASLYSAIHAPDATPKSLDMSPKMFETLRESGPIVDTALQLISLRDDAPCDWSQIVVYREPKPLTDEGDMGDETTDAINAEHDAYNSSGEAYAAAAAEPATDPNTTPPAERSIAPDVEAEILPGGTAASPKNPREPTPTTALAIASAFAPANFDQARRVSHILHSSRLFSAYGSPEAIYAVGLLGQELGMGFGLALLNIHNVEGRATLKADALVARVLNSGKCEYFRPVELSDTSATYATRRVGNPEFAVTFRIEEAERAGLVKDRSGWKKWPLDMCKARCIARLARTIYPDVCCGLYVPEEIEQ